MAETDLHRELMIAIIKTLQHWFGSQPMVYVSGNLLLYYVMGNKRKHVAPDVFVVKGVPKKLRECYLLWEEGKSPNAVIELTSSSTMKEDTDKKFRLYRDVLKVREYFLFDPKGDYLTPRLQGYALKKADYVPISMKDGRLPSKVLGLHLEQAGSELRLFDPTTGKWLLTPEERICEQQHEIERLRNEIRDLHRR